MWFHLHEILKFSKKSTVTGSRSVITWRLGLGKWMIIEEHEDPFWGNVVYILIIILVPWVYVFVKIHRIVQIKYTYCTLNILNI